MPDRAGRLHEGPVDRGRARTTTCSSRAAPRKTDWEVELGVVIGTTGALPRLARRGAARTSPGTPSRHDVSEREFQLERGGQWDKGKSCETFNPLGPWLVHGRRGRRPAGSRAAAVGQRRAAPGRHDRRHDLRGRPRDLVPQPVHGAASPATSSTRAPRPAWRSASRARRTCAPATSSSSRSTASAARGRRSAQAMSDGEFDGPGRRRHRRRVRHRPGHGRGARRTRRDASRCSTSSLDGLPDGPHRRRVRRHRPRFGRSRRSRASASGSAALDILVNNAGIGAVGTVEENTDDEWARVLDVNVVGMARVSAAALPCLRASEHAADRQHLLDRRAERAAAAGALLGQQGRGAGADLRDGDRPRRARASGSTA